MTEIDGRLCSGWRRRVLEEQGSLDAERLAEAATPRRGREIWLRVAAELQTTYHLGQKSTPRLVASADHLLGQTNA